MDYSCYCLHHLASVMFNSELKRGHKLKQLQANGPTHSKKGHKVRIRQYQAVQSHQQPLYLSRVFSILLQQLCGEDNQGFKNFLQWSVFQFRVHYILNIVYSQKMTPTPFPTYKLGFVCADHSVSLLEGDYMPNIAQLVFTISSLSSRFETFINLDIFLKLHYYIFGQQGTGKQPSPYSLQLIELLTYQQRRAHS